MPVSVGEVFSYAGLTPTGCFRWGERLPENRPGVYVISATPDNHATSGGIMHLPSSREAYDDLVKVCPDFSIDGQAGTALTFESRLQQFWLPNEPILYIGLAGTSLANRVNQYYSTRIGRRAPHAGGWWLKALRDLPALFVHYPPVDDATAAETVMIRGFAERLPGELVTGLYDQQRMAPFANVKVPGLGDKRHGFQHYKLKNGTKPAVSSSAPDPVFVVEEPADSPSVTAIPTPSGRNRRVPSQPITEKDRERSSLRIPAESKHFFPPKPSQVQLTVHGQSRTVSWNPRETRSGLLGVGVATMRKLGTTDMPVYIESDGAGYRIIE